MSVDPPSCHDETSADRRVSVRQEEQQGKRGCDDEIENAMALMANKHAKYAGVLPIRHEPQDNRVPTRRCSPGTMLPTITVPATATKQISHYAATVRLRQRHECQDE